MTSLSNQEIETRLVNLIQILDSHKNSISNSSFRLIESHLRQIASDPNVAEGNFSQKIRDLINNKMLNPNGNYRL